jgi:hypothetical protein
MRVSAQTGQEARRRGVRRQAAQQTAPCARGGVRQRRAHNQPCSGSRVGRSQPRLARKLRTVRHAPSASSRRSIARNGRRGARQPYSGYKAHPEGKTPRTVRHAPSASSRRSTARKVPPRRTSILLRVPSPSQGSPSQKQYPAHRAPRAVRLVPALHRQEGAAAAHVVARAGRVEHRARGVVRGVRRRGVADHAAKLGACAECAVFVQMTGASSDSTNRLGQAAH